MSRNSVIKSNLAETDEVSEGVNGNRRLPPQLIDDDESQAIELFSNAISASGAKDEAIASDMGITFQKVSDYRNGKRTLAAHRLVRLARKNRAAGIYIVRALARLVGGLEVRERGRVEKSELRKQLEMSLERNPAMLRVVLADAASALGIDEDEAAEVWDGPTLVDAVR